jgi:hypothetical protein
MLLFDLMCDGARGGRGRRHDDHNATCDVITSVEKIATLPTGESIPHIPSSDSVIAIK